MPYGMCSQGEGYSSVIPVRNNPATIVTISAYLVVSHLDVFDILSCSDETKRRMASNM